MVNYIQLPEYLDFDEDGRPRTNSAKRIWRWDKLHQLQWVRLRSRSIIPPHAFEIERRWKTKLYLARAEHEGSITPGYFDASKKKFLIVWGGQRHAKECGEILCVPGEFVPYSDSNTLLRATPAGLSEQGEPLHFGRVKHYGKFYYGKVQRSHDRVCYVSINGKERAFTKYDIFIRSAVNPEVTNPAPLFEPPTTTGWVHYTFDDVPKNAVVAYSNSFETLYIGRAKHRGSITPGVINPFQRTCTIVWGGDVWPKFEFEVLLNVKGLFVPVVNNEIPPNAFPAGQSEAGETLYIGRARLDDRWSLVGKVHPSHRVCYVPYNGMERGYADYEIFVT